MMRKTSNNIPANNPEQIAFDLRRIRREKKYSQEKLAELSRLSRRTIVNLENAENLGIREVCKIAHSLGYELVLRPRRTIVFEELQDFFKE